MKDSHKEPLFLPGSPAAKLLETANALSSQHRLAILLALVSGPTHVSQLARDVLLSRPLTHMHLQILERAGLVLGRLEMSPQGKALKIFEITPFELVVNLPLLQKLSESHNNKKEK